MRIVHSVLFLVPCTAIGAPTGAPTDAIGALTGAPTDALTDDGGVQVAAPSSAPEVRPAPALLSAVPASAEFVVAIHDTAGFLSDLRSNAWSRVLHDERLWGPDEGPEPLVAELLHLLGPLGTDGADVLHGVLEASRALVFVADFEDGQDAASPASEAGITLALVVRPGSDDAAFDTAWRALLELGRDPAAPTRTRAGQTVARERFVLGGWSALGERTPGGDALVVLARAADALEPFAEASAQGLAERRPAPAWVRDARASAPEGVQLELVARLAGIPASHLGFDEQEAAFYRAVGFDRIRWAYAGARIGAAEEFDLQLALHVPEQTTVSALLATLRPVDPALYRVVPADAMTASFTSIDVRGAWRVVMALLADHMPEQLATLESSIAEVADQVGIDPLEDLLFLFAGDSVEWTTAAPSAGPPSGELRGARMRDVAIATLTDSERFDDSLTELLDAVGVGFALSPHNYGEHEVTSLGLGAEEGGMVWAFSSGALVFGSDAEAVHAALDRWDARVEEGATSLLDHPELGPRVQSVEGAFHLAAFDTAAVLRELLRTLEALGELLRGELTLGLELGSFTLPFPGLVDEYFQGSLLVFARLEAERVVVRFSGR